MKKIVCELCGSNDFSKDGDVFICEYCRTKYTPEQARSMLVEGTVHIDRSNELGNLLSLAKAALANGNSQEAYDYANRVLEIDTTLSEAWLCKGEAAGGSSDVHTLRLTEMHGAFESALQLTAEDERPALRERCASTMTAVALGVYKMLHQYVFGPAIIGRGAWEGHCARCASVLETLETAYAWGGEKQPLENIVNICSDLIGGASYLVYVDATKSNVRHWEHPSPTEEQYYRAEIRWASDELKTLDPTFVEPYPKKGSGCFVVTATMGSETNFYVRTLRDFRDSALTTSSSGRRFIRWYGVHGPALADIISRSPVLRALSFALIVAPASAGAWSIHQFRMYRRRVR